MNIWIDGGSRGNPGPAAAAYIRRGHGTTVVHARYLGIRTNNQAEYEALLDSVRDLNNAPATIYSDSLLLVKQMRGEWSIHNEELEYLAEATNMYIGHAEFVHIPREENTLADRLVNLVLDNA